MNMIKINFIPVDQRHVRGGLLDEGFGQMPREIFIVFKPRDVFCPQADHIFP